jgi:hypothetical protein
MGVEVVRPGADAELVEKQLVTGRGLDGHGHRAVTGAATARLVDQIDREVGAENVLKPLAAVRSGLPTPPGLIGAVQVTIGGAFGSCGT